MPKPEAAFHRVRESLVIRLRIQTPDEIWGEMVVTQLIPTQGRFSRVKDE